jgi:AcrR family transcriptional regulator
MATEREVRQPTSALIITRTLGLFSKMGYEATSMREIAAAVGVKPPSLYNHYRSKEEILWEIVQGALAEILAGQERAFAEHADTLGRFQAFVSFHAEFHCRRSQAAQIVNGNLSSLSGQHYRRAITLRARYEHAFRDLLATGVREGIFDIDDLRVTSFAILEMGMGIAVWFKPDGDLSARQLAERHVKLALRMVGARDEGISS